jgi:hypothetical protein
LQERELAARSKSAAGTMLLMVAGGLLFLVWLLLMAAPAHGQAFKLQGGSSSLYGGHGGSLEVRGLNYTAQLGFGWLDGPRMGFSYATMYRGVLLNFGDQAIPFSLPTDLVNRSYYFLGRGASVSWKTPRRSLFLYSGFTSRSYMLPFFRAADAQAGAGLIFFENQITPQLRFFSQNVISARQTSIQSLEYSLSDRFKLAASAGIGNNQRYWATTLDLDRDWIAVQAGYTVAGENFRRVRVESPVTSENERENIRVELRPLEQLRFVVGRNNYLSPAQDDTRLLRATVNSYAAFASLRGFQLHSSFYDSLNDSGRARAFSAGARRRFGNRLDVAGDFMRSFPSQGPRTDTTVLTVRETITPRLSLTQVITRGSGQTSFAFGGNYVNNRFSASVEYQTLYVPFAVGGDSPYRQVLVLNLRLLLPGFIEVNLGSDVTPIGGVRYTTYATGYAYHGVAAGGGTAGMAGSLHRHVIRGRVVDQSGQPVRGAAVNIGGELVFTDSTGHFTLRRKKAEMLPVAVALDEFILPGRYEVIQAPTQAKAAPEAEARPLEIILRRLVNQPVPERTDPTKLGVPELKKPAGVVGQPLPVVLELTPRFSMGSETFLLPFVPAAGYKGRETAVPSRAKAARTSATQPVGTIRYWPADGSAPVAVHRVAVRYLSSSADAGRLGAGQARGATAGNGTNQRKGVAGTRSSEGKPGGKWTPGERGGAGKPVAIRSRAERAGRK